MPKEEIVDRLTRVFREGGFEAATLSRLTEATGLQRASLYHYFPGGKDEMAGAVLARVGKQLATNVLGVLRGSGAPQERLRRMVEAVDRFYAGGAQNCLLGALSLGDAATRFADELRGAVAGWIDALAALAREAGLPANEACRRAENAVICIQGALVVSRALGDAGPFRRTLDEIAAGLLDR